MSELYTTPASVLRASPAVKVAATALLLLSLIWTNQQAQAGELFTLQPVGGQLTLVAHVTSGVQATGRCWSYDNDRKTAEFEISRPSGYFDGRITLRTSPGRVELSGWRYTHRSWQVTAFSIKQTSDEVQSEYTIRTPAGQPDITVTLVEPNVTLMLIRHPETRPMLGDVLAEIGEDCYFDFDPIVHAQVSPATWKPAADIAEKINGLLPKLRSANWREREKAESQLASLGRDAALYMLLKLDRKALTPEQNMAVDRVVRRYPLLNEEDRELCRREPDRLTAPQGIEPDQVVQIGKAE